MVVKESCLIVLIINAGQVLTINILWIIVFCLMLSCMQLTGLIISADPHPYQRLISSRFASDLNTCERNLQTKVHADTNTISLAFENQCIYGSLSSAIVKSTLKYRVPIDLSPWISGHRYVTGCIAFPSNNGYEIRSAIKIRIGLVPVPEC